MIKMTNDQRQQRTLHVALQEFSFLLYTAASSVVKMEILPALASARSKERTEAKNTVNLV